MATGARPETNPAAKEEKNFSNQGLRHEIIYRHPDISSGASIVLGDLNVDIPCNNPCHLPHGMSGDRSTNSIRHLQRSEPLPSNLLTK